MLTGRYNSCFAHWSRLKPPGVAPAHKNYLQKQFLKPYFAFNIVMKSKV